MKSTIYTHRTYTCTTYACMHFTAYERARTDFSDIGHAQTSHTFLDLEAGHASHWMIPSPLQVVLLYLMSHALFCSCILQSAGLCAHCQCLYYIYSISALQVPGCLINVKLPWSFLTLSICHVIFALCEGRAHETY